MIRSMTGYGSSKASSDLGWTISVECRSVNHRGLEARVHAPREWAWLDAKTQEIVKKYLKRGRVDVRIELERDDSQAEASIVNEAAFAGIAAALHRLADKNGLQGGVTIGDVLQFREVLARSKPEEETESDPAFVQAVEDAVAQLANSRIEEGARLMQTMESLVADVHARVTEVEKVIPDEVEDYRSRLRARVEEAAEKLKLGEVDESRLAYEVVIYADRTAIAEEIQRAHSHLQKLGEVLSDESDAVRGKKVDFYLQELMREANTMGSKTGSTVITDHVVEIKSAIEKMREQAANIE